MTYKELVQRASDDMLRHIAEQADMERRHREDRIKTVALVEQYCREHHPDLLDNGMTDLERIDALRKREGYNK